MDPQLAIFFIFRNRQLVVFLLVVAEGLVLRVQVCCLVVALPFRFKHNLLAITGLIDPAGVIIVFSLHFQEVQVDVVGGLVTAG